MQMRAPHMNRMQLAVIPLSGLLLAMSAGTAAAHDLRLHGAGIAGATDLTRLPLGDGKYSTTAPAVGSIYLCSAPTQQDTIDAPWINGDGTFNATARPVVDGSVSWVSRFTALVQGALRVITGNGLPNHTTGIYPIATSDDAYQYDRNPNSIAEETISGSLTASPALLSSPGCIGSTVGIATNGVQIFNGLDSKGRDAVANELQDACGGHPNAGSAYHYHNLSPCLPDSGSGHSALVGYALDGFGIYGLRGENGVELSNADLDVCHGHTHAIEWDGQTVEMFHYHATNEYPYTVGCFRGRSTRLTSSAGGAGTTGGQTGQTGQQQGQQTQRGATGTPSSGQTGGQTMGQQGQSGQTGQSGGQQDTAQQAGGQQANGPAASPTPAQYGGSGGQSGPQAGGQSGRSQAGSGQQGSQQGGGQQGSQQGGGQQGGSNVRPRP
jgi:hypothetical protein